MVGKSINYHSLRFIGYLMLGGGQDEIDLQGHIFAHVGDEGHVRHDQIEIRFGDDRLSKTV